MSSKVPHAAFCEEYDEDAHEILPDTRLVANITGKHSKSDLRSVAVPFVEAASDSGYSSRTAATANSTQSAPSGRKSPVPLKVDTTLRRADLERVRPRGKDRTREHSARPARDDRMQVGAYPSTAGYPPSTHVPRSPSRSQRRERTYTRHFPGTCLDCDRGLYHASTPVEPRQVEYPYYPPSLHDYPPASPQTSRYPPSAVVQVSHSSRPQARGTRSNSYHANNNRPISFHGAMMPPPMGGGMAYNPPPVNHYEHGPPLSSSAYANTPSYAPSPSLYSQPSPYYGMPDGMPPPDHEERSVSRTREPHRDRGRRHSLYERPPVDEFESTSEEEEDEEEEEEEEEPLEQPQPPPPPAREPRPRPSAHSTHEEYFRTMPRPPLKHKAAPHIIQKRPELARKSATTASVTSERRPSRTLDLAELRDSLPRYEYRRSSRETVIPERNRSVRESRRPTLYHDSGRSARVAVENSRRRQPTGYDDYPATKPVPVPVPLTADALYKAKASSQRAESDSGSQKSRSNSSRGSDARTQNGSGVGSRAEEDNNIVMTMNGVTMSFTQESVGGKRISVRAGETGALELNIEGKRPKKYLTGGSEYTASSASRRGEFDELVRRPRGDRKSDRASRRSSRSTYNGRY
ncbi:hypothetical protein AOCH_007733 [Aspergillus ochraceoroseus]|uniref:Uncharacterized protein n=1 Tax=Aspergillus ochraceoroseus TaxID=138278 RepID=A0A0F8XB21_9EURO|nr:hypothetical protein AOCH_007733 [Aspergillus ochraceoroseus]